MIINMNKIFVKSVKQERWFYIVSFLVIIFGGVSVFASPPAPTPICRVQGVIKGVTLKQADPPPCLDLSVCPTDPPAPRPERYELSISVNSVNYISGTTEFNTCEANYPIEGRRDIFVPKDAVRPDESFAVGQKIEIVTGSSWGAGANSYKLISSSKQRYTQDLSFGMKNLLIEVLQKDLARDPSLYPEGLVTGYFGPLTLKAVQRFQTKYGIVSSGTSVTTGYGRVGPRTRAKLNELYSNQ